MPKTILFMCPHNAAKSILAESFANKLIENLSLTDIEILTAGTDPDNHFSPAVLAYLEEHHLQTPEGQPKEVTEAQIESADFIVSMGCNLSGYSVQTGNILDWNDVPQPSQDLEDSARVIQNKVEELLSTFA